MWLTDPKNKKKSVTLSFFALGFIVATLKLLLAGMTIGGFSFGAFSGPDFAAVIASLGGIYALRRHKSMKDEE